MSILRIEDRNLDKNHSMLPTDVLMRWASAMDHAVKEFVESINGRKDSSGNIVLPASSLSFSQETVYNEETNELVAYFTDSSGELIDITLELNISGHAAQPGKPETGYVIICINDDQDAHAFLNEDNVLSEDLIRKGASFLLYDNFGWSYN